MHYVQGGWSACALKDPLPSTGTPEFVTCPDCKHAMLRAPFMLLRLVKAMQGETGETWQRVMRCVNLGVWPGRVS